MMKMEKSEPNSRRALRTTNGRATAAEWVRASELPSPAPSGHFLREFGQSERDIIQNGNRDSSVTQALLMLNGPLFNQLTAKNTQTRQSPRSDEDSRGKARPTFPDDSFAPAE